MKLGSGDRVRQVENTGLAEGKLRASERVAGGVGGKEVGEAGGAPAGEPGCLGMNPALPIL